MVSRARTLASPQFKSYPLHWIQYRKVQQLKGFSGLAGIGTFALGFPDTILSLDLVTKRYQTFSTATIPGYARDYTTLCTTAGSQYAITAAPIAPITSEQP